MAVYHLPQAQTLYINTMATMVVFDKHTPLLASEGVLVNQQVCHSKAYAVGRQNSWIKVRKEESK